MAAPKNPSRGSSHSRWKGGVSKDAAYQYELQLARLKKIRAMALELLGNRCVRCGFTDPRALQIDHIHGGGCKERKERKFKGTFEKHVIRSFLAGEKKYQLLCANCNWIKRCENKESRGGHGKSE